MRKPAVALILILTVLAASPDLGAQGFKPFELGARAATLGGAFVARADDATAIYFNPAGLAFQPGFRFKFEISYNVLTTTAEPPGSAGASRSRIARFIPQPYVACTIKDFLSVGVAIFSANAMKASWPSTTRSFSSNVSGMNSTSVRPVLAVRVLKSLALGVGVDFIQVRQDWDRDYTFTFAEPVYAGYFPWRIKTNVEGTGIGYVIGWLFKPSARFGFGGKYTSRVNVGLKGKTDLDSTYAYTSTIRGLSTTARTAMPEEIVVGLMAAPLKRLTLHLDYQMIGMSGAMDWMFEVDPKVSGDIERIIGSRPAEGGFGADLALRNTTRLMGGIEYFLGEAFAVRAGYSRLESSVTDANLKSAFPDLATDVLSFGLGYEGPFFDLANRDKKLGGLSADAFFQYGLSQGRKSQYPDYPALYKGNRWSVGVGVGFVF